MKIVTAGDRFTDSDAYGGCIAYAELLRLQGEDALAVLAGTLNESIPSIVHAWGAQYAVEYPGGEDDTFVLVDVSDGPMVASFVSHDKVVEVIDHRPGYEQYWKERGAATDIDSVGAACTLVYERWERAGKFDELPEVSARLLACGILDNTLNFYATITTDRDHAAYAALAEKGRLSDDWPERYFSACGEGILANPIRAITNDTKVMDLAGFSERLAVGQAMLWDASVLLEYREAIERHMETYDKPWFVNLISVSEGKNYILSQHNDVQEFLANVLHVTFTDGLAHTDRLWLRKEIMQRAIDVNALAH